MRFQKGIGYTGIRRPRGPARGDPPYRMSQKAYQTRLRNLGHVERPRTFAETQRLQIEIGLGIHRGESYRGMARRLGLGSHAHCWRVADNYRRGLIPWLPRDEQGLVAMRDSFARAPAQPMPQHSPYLAQQPANEPHAMTADESIAERWREVAEWKRKNPARYGGRRVGFSVAVPL